MRRFSPWVVVLSIILSFPATAGAGALVLDDFDDGQPPNAFGGDYGAWELNPRDPMQYCRESLSAEQAAGGSGYALRLDYRVDSPNPAYNGFWSKLQGKDLRSYTQFSLDIKGDAARGYPAEIGIELKNAKQTGRYRLRGITDQWQHMAIPLAAFAGLTTLNRMTELVVVFDDLMTTPSVGTVYLDNVRFE